MVRSEEDTPVPLEETPAQRLNNAFHELREVSAPDAEVERANAQGEAFFATADRFFVGVIGRVDSPPTDMFVIEYSSVEATPLPPYEFKDLSAGLIAGVTLLKNGGLLGRGTFQLPVTIHKKGVPPSCMPEDLHPEQLNEVTSFLARATDAFRNTPKK